MSGVVPLWAQGGELIPIILAILFIVVPAVLQLIKKAQEDPQKGKARPAQRRPGPAGQGGGGVEDEIEAFLRRAGEQGQAGGRPQAAELVDDVMVLDDPPLGAGIEKEVSRNLDSRKFDEQAGRLGQRMATADSQFDQRVHTVFDHDVSELSHKSGESAAPPVPVGESEELDDITFDIPMTGAAGLPALLANADSLRQAIMINEILTRPEDRWA